MKKIIPIVIALFFCVSTMAQKVGEVAPDFTLKSLNDHNYTLSANRGDVIVVFLVGYNCPLCLASAPTVKSDLFDVYAGRLNFQLLIIDTWDGSYTGFSTFRSTTNLPGTYLQMGSKVATDWSSTYDRLIVIDKEGKMIFKGNSSASNDVELAKMAIQDAISMTTAANDVYLDNKFWAKQNYPNPFSEKTTIRFNLPEQELVSLKIIDLTGKEVAQHSRKMYPAGRNSIVLNRHNLTEGIYFYRLQAGSNSSTGKMIVR